MGEAGYLPGEACLKGFVCVHACSVVSDSVAPWTIAPQTPLSMEFSRQESWSELLCPLPGDLPNLGIKPTSPALAGKLLSTEPPEKPILLMTIHYYYYICYDISIIIIQCVHAQLLQLCLTLCDPMDCSPPDSSVHGIFQARILEWVTFSPPGDFSDPGI